MRWNRVTFARAGRTHKLKKVDLVHTYAYGPTSVFSVRGSHYVTFIDNAFQK